MKKVCLVVLDGWGVEAAGPANAITLEHPPFYEQLLKDWPSTLIDASGPAVGLPEGQMGNSEVGHLNLGAGRLVFMELSRVYQAMEKDLLKDLGALKAVADNGKPVHVMGLMSDGGVHSHIDHWLGVLDALKSLGVKEVYCHLFGDGRDTPPKCMPPYIEQLEGHLQKIGLGKIKSLQGRFYAMDRDKRWERTERAFLCLTRGEGHCAGTAMGALQDCYERGETDEFLEPTWIGDLEEGLLQPGDGVVFMNFRPDRARQLCLAMKGYEEEVGFEVAGWDVCLASLGYYREGLTPHVCFLPERPDGTLSEVLAQRGIRHLKIAETEKYAHVTYFFNGGAEKPFEGEDRIMVPSPKVATYDLKPEMSAAEVTDKLIAAAREHQYRFILVNYANPDMVGHTGDLEAARKAVQTVDECLRRLVGTVVEELDYTLLVTADHGNVERMRDPVTGAAHTAHTTNLVPFVVVNGPEGLALKEGGALKNVAATVLGLMGETVPEEMEAGVVAG